MYAPGMLDELLVPGAMKVLFQPVLEMGPLSDFWPGGYRLHSLEGLIRGDAASLLGCPGLLFDALEGDWEEEAVERAAIEAVLKAAAGLPGEPLVSLNVQGSALASNPELALFLLDRAKAHRLSLHRLVVEIVEHAIGEDGPALSKALEPLRAQGIRIALDDVGRGGATLQLIQDLHPDFLKLDPSFALGIHHDSYKQAMVAALMVLANCVEARLVVKGVEDPLDLKEIESLRVSLIQGNLLARPSPPARWSESLLRRIDSGAREP